MRVTNTIMTYNLLNNLKRSSGKMLDLQNDMSTGKAINKPSDDPAKAGAILGLQSKLASMGQWKANASQAMDYLSSTESVLSDMTSILQRIRALSVEAANGTNSETEWAVIKKEVDQLITQMKVLTNSQVSSKYIFSGTKTDTPPMPSTYPTGGLPPADTADGWQGNATALAVEVGANINIDISVNAIQLFGVDTATGESSFFTTLQQLSEALGGTTADPQQDIADSLDKLDSQINRFIEARAEIGATMNRLNKIVDNLDSSIINAKTNLSNLQDTDLAAAIMDYNATLNTYRASLSVGAQIIQPSLVDFLR